MIRCILSILKALGLVNNHNHRKYQRHLLGPVVARAVVTNLYEAGLIIIFKAA